ncbi:hypothetical protein KAU04_07415, partial [bacterium]|nr:hypothetical protein [bacterium]
MTDQSPGRIVSMRDVLFVIFKRQKMIIAIFLITVATVTIGVFLSTPIYESSTKVMLNREVSEAVLRVAPWYPLMRRFELEEEINSEIELIKSRTVVEAAIEKLDLEVAAQDISSPQATSTEDVTATEGEGKDSEQSRESRILALQKDIVAEPVKKSDIIQIRYSSPDPKRAMDVANAVAEMYIEYRAKIYRASGAVDFFDEQIEIARRNLHQLESALKDYREQEALLSYETQEMILLQKLNEFETSLTKVRKDIISTEAKLVIIRDFMASPLQPLVPSMEIREEKIISDLHDRLIDLRMRLNELLTKYTEEHREILNLRREIAMGEAELRTEVEKVIDLDESSLAVLQAEEDA